MATAGKRARGRTTIDLPVGVSEATVETVYAMRQEGKTVAEIRRSLSLTGPQMQDILFRETFEIPRVAIDPADYPEVRERLEKPLAELFSGKTLNVLSRGGVVTVADLLGVTLDDLEAVPQLGRKRIEFVFAQLARIGFHRRGREPVERDSS